MSGTPRTDALLLEVNEGRVYADSGPVIVLARQLERELGEAWRVITAYQRLHGATVYRMNIDPADDDGDPRGRIEANYL